MTNWFEQNLLVALFNGSGSVGALNLANAYVSLHLEAYAEAGTQQEVTGTAYARQAVSCDAPSGWGLSTEGGGGYSEGNSAEINFPAAGDNWGNILSVGLWASSSGGSMIFGGDLTTPKVIASGDIFRFNSGSLLVIAR